MDYLGLAYLLIGFSFEVLKCYIFCKVKNYTIREELGDINDERYFTEKKISTDNLMEIINDSTTL